MRSDRPRAFLVAAGLLGCGLFALCAWVASREWFAQDDFAFLAHVQREGWSWGDAFLPMRKGFWWAYRPLGMDVFFYLGFRAFGWNAFGYQLVALAVHFLAGAVALRLARQLGFDLRVAATTALLCVSRHPSLDGNLYPAAFHYALAVLGAALSVSLFLDHLRDGRRGHQLGSLAALGAALLSNEFAAAVPAVLVAASLRAEGVATARTALPRALRRAAPQLVLAGVYVFVRFRVLDLKPPHAGYAPSLGWHVFGNAGDQIAALFGGPLPAIGALLGIAAIAASPAVRAGLRGDTARWLLGVNALCLFWGAVCLLPFALLPYGHPRYSIALQLPAALLVGSYLELLWRAFGARYPRRIEAALLALVLVSVPYGALRARALEPRGDVARRLIETVERRHPRLDDEARIVLVHNGPGLADAADAAELRVLLYGGTGLFKARYPEKKVKLRFRDRAAEGPVRPALCRRCVYFRLLPDLRVEPLKEPD